MEHTIAFWKQVVTTASLIAVVISQRWSQYEWLVASLVYSTASASQLLYTSVVTVNPISVAWCWT